MLEVLGLEKRYDQIQALSDVGLRVEGGQIAGLVGPNGAGKTTTMRAILGLIRCDRGEVRIDGALAKGVVRADRIGALLDRPSVYPYLSGQSNLEVAALALMGRSYLQYRLTALVARVGLSDVAARPVRTYSTGQRQRLGIAMSLVGDAPILVLDEPAAGLDPAGIADLRIMLEELAREGRAILLSSHLLHEIEQLCDVVIVINKGRVVSNGPPPRLIGAATDLVVSFATEADVVAAAGVLRAQGFATSRRARAIVVEAASGRARGVSEMLGRAGLYPTELRSTDRGLEHAYLKLTGANHVRGTND